MIMNIKEYYQGIAKILGENRPQSVLADAEKIAIWTNITHDFEAYFKKRDKDFNVDEFGKLISDAYENQKRSTMEIYLSRDMH